MVEGTRIVERVARGATPERIDATFDASRHVVLPGLVNTHHHFYQTLTRAHPSAINKPLFAWLIALYPIWARLKPHQLRLATRLALTELMLSGCTTAADHHYLYPAGLENAVDIEVEEARALGMRMTVSRGSMNLSEKDGGLPPDSVVQDEETILADSERVLKLFHDPKPGAQIRVALAPCSPFSISKELMSESAAPRRALRVPASHPPLRNRGRGAVLPKDVWPEAGRSSRGNRLDVEPRLARSRHSFQRRRDRAAGQGRRRRQPLRGLEHGAGVGDMPDLRARGGGLAVGLGVDGSASNDSSNMMEALRHALMIGRLRYGADKVTHRDVLRWATEGSARCLGRSDIGRIEAGYEADLALFKLDEPRFSGAHDPLAALVLCGAHRADRVMIAGEWRVVDGEPVGLDLDALIAEHKRAARDFA